MQTLQWPCKTHPEGLLFLISVNSPNVHYVLFFLFFSVSCDAYVNQFVYNTFVKIFTYLKIAVFMLPFVKCLTRHFILFNWSFFIYYLRCIWTQISLLYIYIFFWLMPRPNPLWLLLSIAYRRYPQSRTSVINISWRLFLHTCDKPHQCHIDMEGFRKDSHKDP